MNSYSLRGAVQVAIGVVIAAAVLHTWLVLGWIVPVTVSGSSMAPALLGQHRSYRCPNCRREFAVGLDQLPVGDAAVCPNCGQRRAMEVANSGTRGERLAVDRTAFVWRAPQRWEVVVFRCPENASDLCVKRVVGLPGEAVTLEGGDVLVNGRIVRKSLAEQRAVRHLIDATGDDANVATTRMDGVLCRSSDRWRSNESDRLAYHHLGNAAITDEFSYNQGAASPENRVADIMLTYEARLAGTGQLVLSAAAADRCEVVADFSRHEIALKSGDRTVVQRSLPAAAGNNSFVEWTVSFFDRQVLVAIGDDVVLAEPWELGQSPGTKTGVPLAIGIRGLTGEIRRVAVWRDVFYAVRHSDGRQAGVERDVAVAWRLGPGEYFVLGDNAAISDDSRSWPSGPGVDAKLLIGKPLGVR